ncbi:MAG: hypothetical protein KJ626_06885 [Verrucomicrobia bacterium]|nr:hypothetical protein [Verrucomicrobiota bacterium]
MNSHISAMLSRLLLDRSGGHRLQVLRDAEMHRRSDVVSEAQRRHDQQVDLARLLCHARDHVPVFSRLLGADGSITPENAYEVLARLPVMDKKSIQKDPAGFVATYPMEKFSNSTGGSSGIPLNFKVDRERRIAGDASHYWANGLAGWTYGDRVAMLWGADRDVKDVSQTVRSKLRAWVDNVRWCNAFDMGPERMDGFHRQMKSFRPHIMIAYAGSAFTFARHLESRGIIPDYPLKGIITSAEVLTAEMRTCIERVFPVRVFDRYGSREFGPLAAECEAHEGLHLNEGDAVVEIESADPLNVPGRLIVTYLRNFAMPFIRYDTGDMACFLRDDVCSCGRTTRRFQRVVGRMSDTIRTASGSLVHGEYFTHIFYGVSGVEEFQFVQEEINRYRLLLVGDRGRAGQYEAEWREAIAHAVGQDAEVTIEYVDRIPALSSGKRRFTLSLLEG